MVYDLVIPFVMLYLFLKKCLTFFDIQWLCVLKNGSLFYNANMIQHGAEQSITP